jgi:CheY-like chemotaxis protein
VPAAIAGNGEFLPAVLMDIQLPIMDGYTATRRIKGDPALRSIPIIAVTSYALSGEEKTARAAGCDDYVPKPFSPRHPPASRSPSGNAIFQGRDKRRSAAPAAAANALRQGSNGLSVFCLSARRTLTPVSAVGKRDFAGQRQRRQNGT